MSKTLFCRLYECDHVSGNICCTRCKDRHRCKSSCLNDPAKCGQSVKIPKGQVKIFAEVKK